MEEWHFMGPESWSKLSKLQVLTCKCQALAVISPWCDFSVPGVALGITVKFVRWVIPMNLHYIRTSMEKSHLCGLPRLHLFAYLKLHFQNPWYWVSWVGDWPDWFWGWEKELNEAIRTLVTGRTIVTGTGKWETAGGWEEFSLKGGTRDSCQMWGPENSDKWRTHAVYNLK